jgi:hypothetical protein
MPNLSKLPKKFRDNLPKTMLDALNELNSHEVQIMEALSNPAMAKLFAEDPAEALKAMNVPVNPFLLRKLKEVFKNEKLYKIQAYSMPNGQTLKPNVRIHFVKGGN